MPSVGVGISDALDEHIEWMVETGRAEDRSDAARQLMEWAAHNKHGADV